MKEKVVAERYARALFEVAQDRREGEAVARDVEALGGILDREPSFARFLGSPQIPKESKRGLLSQVFSPLFSGTTLTFLFFVIRRRRIRALPEILEEYRRISDVEYGVQTVQMVTAVPLDGAVLERLTHSLRTWAGKQVDVVAQVNPWILGGAILRLDHRIIDGSLRRSLRNLEEGLRMSRV